jgi:class 3 adenylate cyclase/pimeloyl-ACP methyl ester carboxylesterase
VDIAAWLRELGLERYEPAFRENEIDWEVLPELTEGDLDKLGLPLGPRRKLLKAIAGLSGKPTAVATEAASSPKRRAPEAERRQLTVMFVDLVGSTALSAQLDPEEMRQVIRAYQNAVAGEITRFGGYIAKYMGDGVLVYFGYPRAQEDDAERAVRAALAVIGEVARLRPYHDLVLQARLGIATGLVVVGDTVGEGAAREEAVVGETPNLAARLQQLAEPGTVVLADSTRRLLAQLFHLRDLGARALHGFPAPVRAWQVAGEGRTTGRFEARHSGDLTPLVGREHEVALLLDRWRLAHEGEGQAVLLAGEPGVGKSRLAQAVRQRLGDERHVRLLYQCSPQHTGSALHPIAAQLEHAAGFSRDDEPGARLAKLKALLAQGADDVATAAPLFAALLAIPPDGPYPLLELSPQQRKERMLEALLVQLEGVAARQPVLLVFEDLHWIDPTSLEFLGLLVDRVAKLPVLMILTARPEFAPPWSARAHLTVLTLNRLGRRHTATLAQRVSVKALPPEILDEIVARTDGVPLFVEELTRTVLESGLLEDEGERYGLRGPLPTRAIPTTLHDSLMARLDRLAGVKEVAQVAAVIGREFTHEMLALVVPLDEWELGAALDQLAGSDLILRHGTPGRATYSFRHALVQEAAYGSLLKSRRQELHARIAKAVEERFPNVSALRPEWLAHHYTEAGLIVPAAEHWLRAAERAKEAYANREATSHLHRCLDAIEARRPGDGGSAVAVEGHRLRALVLLGDLASLAGNLEEANRCYEQALALAPDAEVRARIENKRHRPRTAIRDGARIAYYEHGSGPDTLVFVAPLAYGLAAFQPILERLCQEFRIVTIDPRGTGASDPLVRPYLLSEHVKDVRAVIAAVGGGPLVGVGISRGGNLLVKLAHAEPHLFAKLITIGCSPGMPGPPFFTEEYRTQYQMLVGKGDLEPIVRFHTALVFSEPATRELQELFLRTRLELPNETMLSFFDPDPTVEVTQILREVAVPVLVTHGSGDRMIEFMAAEFIAARLPDARIYAFEGKGHMPLFTATDEFCTVLREFVRTGTIASMPSPEDGAAPAAGGPRAERHAAHPGRVQRAHGAP